MTIDNLPKLWDTKWQALGNQEVNTFAIDIFENYLDKSQKDISILDLGCGNGADTLYFHDKGFKDITALDFSPYGINKIKEKVNIKTILEDMESAEFPKNTFNVIYAHLSLHYFEDELTKELFQKAYSWLKEDGILCVKCKSTKDKNISSGTLIGKDIYRYNGEHIRHLFSKEYMLECLNFAKGNDGEVLYVKETNGPYHGNPDSAFIEAVVKK